MARASDPPRRCRFSRVRSATTSFSACASRRRFLHLGAESDPVNQIAIARRQDLVERLIPAIHSPIPDRFLWKAARAGTTVSEDTPSVTSGSLSRSAPRASTPSPRCLAWRIALLILTSKRTRCESGSQDERSRPDLSRVAPGVPPDVADMSGCDVRTITPIRHRLWALAFSDVDPRRGRRFNRATAQSSSPT
jgi:hypothetical protein